MNYKNKYEQAIKRAKAMIKVANNQEETYNSVITIFPELKESEDEQSKKWILEYLYDGLRKSDEQFKGQFKAAIAWLEKQGKQKPKFRVGDTIKCKYDDRQFTIKSVDLDKETYTYTQEGCGNDIDYADEEFELVEQKSDWSGEDDEHLERILKELENQRQRPLNSPYLDKIESDYNWLKSLKNRVQPQPKQGEQKPTWSDDFEEEMDRYIEENFYGSADNGFFSNRTKRELEVEDVVRFGCHFAAWQKEQSNKELSDKPKQEWSEEDEEMLKMVIKLCEQCGNEYAYYWLKSLKDRVQPQQEKERILGKLEEWLDEYISNLADVGTDTLIGSFRKYLDGKLPVKPKSQWKPSEEQMKCLSDVVHEAKYKNDTSVGGYSAYMPLVSLYLDLKKLKG